MKENAIVVEGVTVHNLKNVSCTLPHGKFYCLTGVSGSGKSSFAFDTIFVEGQRRYVESLSHHAKRLIGNLPKPDAISISGLTPTIAIEQKTAGKNPRSTVGTLTEIYDYLRLLFAKCAIPYCPDTFEPLTPLSREAIIETVTKEYTHKKILILSPVARAKKSDLKNELADLEHKGFTRVRLDNNLTLIESAAEIEASQPHDLDVVIDRIEVSESSKARLQESLITALDQSDGILIIVDSDTQNEMLFSQHAYSKKSGKSYPQLEAQDFSFNSPQGMCPECHGLGTKFEFVLEKIIDQNKSIKEGFSPIASSYDTVRYKNIYDNLASQYDFSVDEPWKNLSKAARDVILYGTKNKWTRMIFVHPETGATWHDTVQWKGILEEAWQRYQQATSDVYKRNIERYMEYGVCQGCKGSRLKPYPAAARFFNKTIFEIVQMTILDAHHFFESLRLKAEDEAMGQDALKSVIERLSFLLKVGLGYISLDRTAPTLSGGESQRVRLASQIGSGLVGVTYILDEPSIGLHPQDNNKLIHSLKALRDKGNTVIVVEHDEETICAADTLIDFGPKAGKEGGKILFQGPPSALIESGSTLTAEYLSGKKAVFDKKQDRGEFKKYISLTNPNLNNLKDITLKLPLERFVAVTGVSGSGKSSLFLETLFPALSNKIMGSQLTCGDYASIEGLDQIDKVIEIDQSPIGRTPRSNPATYTKVFDDIRSLFAQLPESKVQGFEPGRFSFNVKEGSCSSCGGMGAIKVDLDLVEESWTLCPECEGKRFDEQTLSIKYKGYNIQEILEMTVLDALNLFQAHPSISKKLKTLARVGLDYITLGQSATTISGGEAQRLKLARELSRPATGKTLYILDEPSTGLHFHDLGHLLSVLHELVDRGNSVVVIEHNLDLVMTADWIIDMGPGSGNEGGRIIDAGTVQEILKKNTPTGIALRRHLDKSYLQPETFVSTNHSVESIHVHGARQNNLDSLTLEIPRGKITTVVGPSGSGKSSLVFDTIFAEGQRRYVESLSPYVRQFVKQQPKPRVDWIEGLSPSIAVEAKQGSSNPRSTVGTLTEAYDYLRVLWSQVGLPEYQEEGNAFFTCTKDRLLSIMEGVESDKKISLYTPILVQSNKDLLSLAQEGYSKILFKNKEIDLSESTLNKVHKGTYLIQIDRFKSGSIDRKRFLNALEVIEKRSGIATVIIDRDTYTYRLISNSEITPKSFAFNTKAGMCPDCEGLGVQYGIDIQSLGLPQKSTLSDLFNHFCSNIDRQGRLLLQACLKEADIAPKSSIHDIPQSFLSGSKTSYTTSKSSSISFRGINHALEIFLKEHRFSDDLPHGWSNALQEHTCPSCSGDRIHRLAASVKIDSMTLPSLCSMPIIEALSWLESRFDRFQSDKSLTRAYEEAVKRLKFLDEIGIGYLSLHRSAQTLSGGEAQRVRLASQLGLGLGGILYVLDEPTIGLHPLDTKRLIGAFEKLKSLNNTLLIVEHDPQIIQISDHILELGQGAGKDGGKLLFKGSPAQIKRSSSPTGKYLSDKLTIRKGRTLKKSEIKISDASCHNIKNLTCSIPKEAMTCIVGVSGSGKSTFVFDILKDSIEKQLLNKESSGTGPVIKGGESFSRIVSIDQKPVGMTARSDIATFMDIMTPLRQFFALLPEAQARGLKPIHFGPSNLKGMCRTCWGLGVKRVEMNFMAPLMMTCPSCNGSRLNPVALSVRYRGKNLGEIFQMGADDACGYFEHIHGIKRVLDILKETGLGYLPLGQMIQTVSGGELQRLKVARELAKRRKGTTLYLFDEPTRGLHPREVENLISILHGFVDAGHTVIVVEHNCTVIGQSDYVLEFGPGSGLHGGKIISQGTPEDIMKNKNSPTGKILKKAHG